MDASEGPMNGARRRHRWLASFVAATMTKVAACPGVPADRTKLTVYPDLFHDGWDQAYSGSIGDDIDAWMLSFSKP